MNILAFSIAKIYGEKVTGGATRTLRDLCVKLGERGHQIRILSPYLAGVKSLELSIGVTVYPILKYKDTFPHPFDVSFTNHVDLIRSTMPHIDWSDVCYIHDAGYPYRNIFFQKPVVVSIRDLIYPESIIGALNNSATCFVVNSEYTSRCLKAAYPLFENDISKLIQVIPSGIDMGIFKPIRKKRFDLVDRYISIEKIKDKYPVLLHPHRADPRKGINESLKLLELLKETGRYDHPVLLAPVKDLDGRSLDVFIPGYLKNHVILHDVVPYSLMPYYYSLGDITLCLGTYVEGFGPNASVESLSCGIPVIQTKIGPAKDQRENNLIKMVEPKNEEDILQAALKILSNNIFYRSQILFPEFVSVEKMTSMYEKVFDCVTEKLNNSEHIMSMVKRKRMASRVNKFVLAPWCSWFGDRIYHEFNECFFEDWPNNEFLEFVRSNEVSTNDIMLKTKCNQEVFQYLTYEYYLVPAWVN